MKHEDEDPDLAIDFTAKVLMLFGVCGVLVIMTIATGVALRGCT